MTPQASPIIGCPGNDGPDTCKQQFADTCAIRCQEYIIERFTGIDLPQTVYRDEAANNGWYAPGHGTDPKDVGKLLELNGIPVNRYEHGNVFNLTSELAQGHKVIIGVHAEDLWEHNPVLNDYLNVTNTAAPSAHMADHAVMVSGIDTSDPNHVQVIISDPGTGEPAARYPLDTFLNAWKDSDFFMVATQNAPPENLHWPEMQNFDYSAGHISHIGSMPWEDFAHIAGDFASHPVNEIAANHDQGLWHEFQVHLEDFFSALHIDLHDPLGHHDSHGLSAEHHDAFDAGHHHAS